MFNKVIFQIYIAFTYLLTDLLVTLLVAPVCLSVVIFENISCICTKLGRHVPSYPRLVAFNFSHRRSRSQWGWGKVFLVTSVATAFQLHIKSHMGYLEIHSKLTLSDLFRLKSRSWKFNRYNEYMTADPLIFTYYQTFCTKQIRTKCNFIAY